MQITTFFNRNFLVLVLFLVASPVWSYGGGGGGGGYVPKCVPPKFKNLKPAKNIEPGGQISFTASSNTLPNSIQVIIKEYKVDLDVRDHYGYQVTGNLPNELSEGFVLANIVAHSSPNSCITEQKWLLKIEQQKPVEVEEVEEVEKLDDVEVEEGKTNVE